MAVGGRGRAFTAIIGRKIREVRAEPEGEGLRIRIDAEEFSVRCAPHGDGEALLLIDGTPRIVQILELPQGRAVVSAGSREIEVALADPNTAILKGRIGAAGQDARIELRSPMHGTVVQIAATEGAVVEEEAPLVVLEAMKMQNALASPARAIVRRILVEPGQTVEGDALLVELERLLEPRGGGEAAG